MFSVQVSPGQTVIARPGEWNECERLFPVRRMLHALCKHDQLVWVAVLIGFGAFVFPGGSAGFGQVFALR
jgi:hypothetical protein